MPLRYAGNCTTCGVRVEQGVEAWYDPATKVTCTKCRPVGAQLGMDVAAASEPSTPMRSARTDLEKGTELEQRIADVFSANGYRVQTNVVREGRSGASHEIDVLAEKTDDLLTLSVAVECKAWNNPIEKDVIAKFDFARRDLGLGHALVVSLNGARAGAVDTARELGVIVWGPDEIQAHVGRSAVTGLQNRPKVEEVGFPRRLADDEASALIAKATAGRLGIGKEEIVWESNAWIPVALTQLTLRKYGPLQRKMATTQAWAVYDLVGGVLVARLDSEPERTPVAMDGPRLEQLLKLTEPGTSLERIIAKWDKATGEATIQKYRTEMDRLGIPAMHTATVGTSTSFLYPVRLAIARRNTSERVVVVDCFCRRLDDDLGRVCSKQIAAVRSSVGA